MRRREFISVIAGTAVWPLRARAEQPAMPVVGFLAPERTLHLFAAFAQGLAEAGYVEGKKPGDRIPFYQLQTRVNA